MANHSVLPCPPSQATSLVWSAPSLSEQVTIMPLLADALLKEASFEALGRALLLPSLLE